MITAIMLAAAFNGFAATWLAAAKPDFVSADRRYPLGKIALK